MEEVLNYKTLKKEFRRKQHGLKQEDAIEKNESLVKEALSSGNDILIQEVENRRKERAKKIAFYHSYSINRNRR